MDILYPTATTSADLIVGQRWSLRVLALSDGYPASDVVPLATVTAPDGTFTATELTLCTAGVYEASIPIDAAGRWLADVTATGYGAVAFVAYAVALVDETGMPDLADALDYLRGQGDMSWSDPEVQDALDAEAAAQRAVCRIPPAYGADLRQALLRRVACNLARRPLPLAMVQGDAESGPFAVGNDVEVRRLEKPWRRRPIG